MQFLAPLGLKFGWKLAMAGVLLVGPAVQAAEPPPPVLFDAAQCLATSKEDWLSLARRNPMDLEMGYVLDPKGFAGQQMLYVVDYSSPLHTEGTVAVYTVEGKKPQLTLRLQYNVPFQQSGDGMHSIRLVNPPFGGIGTQERVISAIRKVGSETWTIPVQSLVTRPNEATCESDAPSQ